MNFLKTTQKRLEKTSKSLTKAIKLKSYRKLAVNFLILTVNLIIIILYFTLSEATIGIVPVQETFSHTVRLAIVKSATGSQDPLVIAGELVSVPISHEQIFPLSGGNEVTSQARGQITIINAAGGRNQTFVRNTRFKNEAGIEIKTDQHVVLAPGASVTIPAYASQEGKTGEVGTDAGRFQVVALPYLKDQIYAEVTTPFTGGVRLVTTLTQEAYDAAAAKVEQSLKEKAAAEIAKQYPDIPSAAAPGVSITSIEGTAKVGDKDISEFALIAKGTASAFTYDANRAKEIVAQELIKAIPPDKIFVSLDDASYTATPDAESNMLAATMGAQVQPKLPEVALNQEDIVGMNRDEVREHFQKITGIRDVEVTFWPFWVRSVPNLTDHVNIEIKM